MDEREQLLVCANQSAPAIKVLADCEDKYLKLLGKEAKFKKREGWVWLGMILCPLLALGALSFIFSGEGSPSSRKTDTIGVLVMLVLTTLCVWTFVKHLKRKKLIAEANAELDRAQADPALSWLPPKYRITTYIYKIIEYLTNMRAKTLQEALNLLEVEIHQTTMENLTAFGAL